MPDTEHAGVIDREALKNYANRIVSLRADRKAINEDMGEVFKQAKDAGFVPEMIRGVVREMEMEEDARGTFYSTQESYRRALGLLADTPLGVAAVEAAASAPPPRSGRRPRPFAQQTMSQNGSGEPAQKTGPKTPAEAAAEVFKPKGQQPNGSSLQIHD